MRFFHKRKCQKIIEAYAEEYQRAIPENVIAREELLKLKRLNLEELAASYDLHEGHQYYKGTAAPDGLAPSIEQHIPDLSMCTPSIEPAWKARELLNIAKQIRFRERHPEYLFYPEFNKEIKLITTTNRCWKCL